MSSFNARLTVAVAILAGLAVLSALPACTPRGAGQARGPSFACPGKTATEAAICADPKLSAYDRQMAELFATSRRAAFGDAPSQQLAQQRDWLKQGTTECSKGSRAAVTRCLTAYYQDRIVDLARADMFATPDAAFAALKDLQPEAEPMYRAMYLYATMDDPQKRAQAVLPLIKPYYDRHEGPYEEDAIKTVNDALASDRNFGLFVDWTWIKADYPQIVWPCGVLHRRPGLIDTMGAQMGSALDNRVPDSDCDVTAPEIPGLDALVVAADNAQPPCDGTIRFSTGREYEKLQTAVRLHYTSAWQAVEAPEAPEPAEAAFRGKHAAAIARARAGLADYYVRYFGAPAADAKRDAGAAVDNLVRDPFYVCD